MTYVIHLISYRYFNDTFKHNMENEISVFYILDYK